MTTNNNIHPVRAMMKPLPDLGSRSALRAQQEERVYNHLCGADRSLTARDVAKTCDNIPGITVTRYSFDRYRVRECSSILRRLEAKGRIISTLYGGYRYYSAPIGGEN